MRLLIAGSIVVLLFALSGCSKFFSHSNSNVGSAGIGSGTTPTGGSPQARTLLEQGKTLYRNDQDSEAVEAFKQAVALDPDLAEAHFRLGLAYEALNRQEDAEGEYKKAVNAYKKFVDANPKDWEAHYLFGQTYASLQQYSDAIREYRQAVKLKNDDADIYYDLGIAHSKLAQYDEASSAFTKSLDIDPDNYRAQDALDEAREGVKRIRAGRKHQGDILKKQKEEELKKAGEEGQPTTTPPAKPTPGKGT
jgi:tetratricopeptide (TPR) repeat protein